MYNMDNSALLVSMLFFLFTYSTQSDVQIPDVNLQEHVKKIDEMLVEMQSHSKAQEQKSSAVLSSLLSQLTQTTDKLQELETNDNLTIFRLEKNDAEISQLWTSYNATASTLSELAKDDKEACECHNETTVELQEIRAEHNKVVMELEVTKSKLDGLEKRSDSIGKIGFHGRLQKDKKTVIVNKPIVFDKVLFDSGSTYNTITGKFIVPMNGTYQIWIGMVYQQPRINFYFSIQKENNNIERAYGSKFDLHGTSSTITMAYLQQGESMWVTSSANVFLYSDYCNFGVVLLNAH